MVEVATKLDVPIKLLWPKSINFSDESGFTLLGLGDVVIPGVSGHKASADDLSVPNQIPSVFCGTRLALRPSPLPQKRKSL